MKTSNTSLPTDPKRKALPLMALLTTPLPVSNTAISRKVVAKNVHATTPKGNMGYDQCTVPDTVAVEPTFFTFV